MELKINYNQNEIEDTTFENILSKSEFTVLYFYPKDNTSGCSIEAAEFSKLNEEFLKYGVQIVGVSKDSTKSHTNFIEKLCITFPLISDESTELHQQFGAWGEKSMYGRKYMGAMRNTYLLNNKGETVQEWKNVKAPGHAQSVLNYITENIK